MMMSEAMGVIVGIFVVVGTALELAAVVAVAVVHCCAQARPWSAAD